MIHELDLVVLSCDLPDRGLRAGDVGTVVHSHRGGAGYEVDFATLSGEILAVVTLAADSVRPIGSRELAHVRSVV